MNPTYPTPLNLEPILQTPNMHRNDIKEHQHRYKHEPHFIQQRAMEMPFNPSLQFGPYLKNHNHQVNLKNTTIITTIYHKNTHQVTISSPYHHKSTQALSTYNLKTFAGPHKYKILVSLVFYQNFNQSLCAAPQQSHS